MEHENKKRFNLNVQKRLNLFITLFSNSAFRGFRIEKHKDEENQLTALTVYCKNCDIIDVYKIAEVTRTHVHFSELVLEEVKGHGVFKFAKIDIG
jgi:hypothetical protein